MTETMSLDRDAGSGAQGGFNRTAFAFRLAKTAEVEKADLAPAERHRVERALIALAEDATIPSCPDWPSYPESNRLFRNQTRRVVLDSVGIACLFLPGQAAEPEVYSIDVRPSPRSPELLLADDELQAPVEGWRLRGGLAPRARIAGLYAEALAAAVRGELLQPFAQSLHAPALQPPTTAPQVVVLSHHVQASDYRLFAPGPCLKAGDDGWSLAREGAVLKRVADARLTIAPDREGEDADQLTLRIADSLCGLGFGAGLGEPDALEEAASSLHEGPDRVVTQVSLEVGLDLGVATVVRAAILESKRGVLRLRGVRLSTRQALTLTMTPGARPIPPDGAPQPLAAASVWARADILAKVRRRSV